MSIDTQDLAGTLKGYFHGSGEHILYYMIFDYDKNYNPIATKFLQIDTVDKSILLENILKTYIYIRETYKFKFYTENVILVNGTKFKLFNFHAPIDDPIHAPIYVNPKQGIFNDIMEMSGLFEINVDPRKVSVERIVQKLSKYTSAIYNIYLNIYFYRQHAITAVTLTYYKADDKWMVDDIVPYTKLQLMYENKPDIIDISKKNRYYGTPTTQERNESIKLYYLVNQIDKLTGIASRTSADRKVKIEPYLEAYKKLLMNVVGDIPPIPPQLINYIKQ